MYNRPPFPVYRCQEDIGEIGEKTRPRPTPYIGLDRPPARGALSTPREKKRAYALDAFCILRAKGRRFPQISRT